MPVIIRILGFVSRGEGEKPAHWKIGGNINVHQLGATTGRGTRGGRTRKNSQQDKKKGKIGERWGGGGRCQ